MFRSLKLDRLILAAAVASLAASPSWATGKLAGKTLDDGGNPIGGVVIKIIPLDRDLPVVEVKSKKNGKFIFGLLRPARYRLVAFADGMRVSHIDVNLAVPDDESLWAVDEAIPPGAPLPDFNVSGVTKVSYDLTFTPSPGDPGEFGTGQPLSPTTVIVDLMQAGKFEEALVEVDRSAEFNPNNPTIFYLKGFALSSLGRTDEAAQAADKVLQLDPDFEGANLLMGKVREGQGDLNAALECYTKETQIAQSTEVRRDAHLGRATTYIKLERLEEAAAALEQVVALDPANVGAQKELADLYMRLGRSDEARRKLEQVAALGETDPNILYNMGAERYNAGDLETAADYFSKAIEANPGFADAHRQLAFAQLSLGNRAGAIEHLNKFVELKDDEQDPQVQQVMAMLQQLVGQD